MNNLVLPKHIAFILDGNRRFGSVVLGDRLKGHKYGANKIETVLKWCNEFNINTITMWIFSTENFNRSNEEVKALMDLFESKFNELAESSKIHENEIKISIMGCIDLFPERVKKAVKKAVDATKNYNKFNLNFGLGYGGQKEIIDAVKRLVKLANDGKITPDQVDRKLFEEHLYVVGLPKPDLIIRTGAVQRTSGFMAWSSDYAEWYFSNNMWPEFEKNEFIKALTDYSERKRRFGR